MKKKVANIICELLIEQGITDCFMLTGGGAMHLNDSFGNNSSIRCTYFLHEQSAAIAAEAYARVDNNMPVVCVTTGPGGTNALTGVLCAWLDNIPMLVISGQVKTSNMIDSTGLPLRQFGEQEYNIVDVASKMTKYSITVTNPLEIKYCIQKAMALANSGRRGPCWIDIPLDVQGTYIEENDMMDYSIENEEWDFDKDKVIKLLENSERLVVIAGSAIRSSDSYMEFQNFCRKYCIPVVAAKSVADILTAQDENYFGNFGVNGGRAGNFIIQNADCILALGCRLSFGQIGFDHKSFSPNSKKIVVDVDENELCKETMTIDCPIHCDLKDFLKWINHESILIRKSSDWIQYCRELKRKFPIYQDKFKERENVNPYCFAKALQNEMKSNAICVVGNSCSSVSIKQCGIKYENQRMWGNINCGTMGYDIPAAIGASIASEKQVICCAGDGSFQLNIQELQTIVNYNLPIKIFVFNNGGYKSIFISQMKNFGRLSGCTQESGLGLPDIERVAYAYKIPYMKCEKNLELSQVIDQVLGWQGYIICEIVEDSFHEIEPKLSNRIMENGQIVSPPLTDLYPFLEREIYDRYSTYSSYLRMRNE